MRGIIVAVASVLLLLAVANASARLRGQQQPHQQRALQPESEHDVPRVRFVQEEAVIVEADTIEEGHELEHEIEQAQEQEQDLAAKNGGDLLHDGGIAAYLYPDNVPYGAASPGGLPIAGCRAVLDNILAIWHNVGVRMVGVLCWGPHGNECTPNTCAFAVSGSAMPLPGGVMGQNLIAACANYHTTADSTIPINWNPVPGTCGMTAHNAMTAQGNAPSPNRGGVTCPTPGSYQAGSNGGNIPGKCAASKLFAWFFDGVAANPAALQVPLPNAAGTYSAMYPTCLAERINTDPAANYRGSCGTCRHNLPPFVQHVRPANVPAAPNSWFAGVAERPVWAMATAGGWGPGDFTAGNLHKLGAIMTKVTAARAAQPKKGYVDPFPSAAPGGAPSVQTTTRMYDNLDVIHSWVDRDTTEAAVNAMHAHRALVVTAVATPNACFGWAVKDLIPENMLAAATVMVRIHAAVNAAGNSWPCAVGKAVTPAMALIALRLQTMSATWNPVQYTWATLKARNDKANHLRWDDVDLTDANFALLNTWETDFGSLPATVANLHLAAGVVAQCHPTSNDKTVNAMKGILAAELGNGMTAVKICALIALKDLEPNSQLQALALKLSKVGWDVQRGREAVEDRREQRAENRAKKQ